MKCDDLNINMFDLLEGKLEAESVKEFRDHIELCDTCRARYAFIEGAIGQIESEKEITITPGFADKILQVKVGNKRPVFTIRRVLAPLAAAAVIVFGIITGMFISGLTGGNSTDMYADLPDEYYYTNEIHLETIETFFLVNED